VLFPALGNHAGLQTSDLRSAGTRALDGAAASGSAVTASSGLSDKKKRRKSRSAMSAQRRFETSLKRLKCANSNHSTMASRKVQSTLCEPLGCYVNGENAPVAAVSEMGCEHSGSSAIAVVGCRRRAGVPLKPSARHHDRLGARGPRGAPSLKPTASVLCSTRSVMARASILTQSGRSPCVGSVKERLSGRAKNRRSASYVRCTFWAAVCHRDCWCAGDLVCSLDEAVIHPMNWSTLRYVFRQTGGPECRGSITSRKRSSRSCARSMCWYRKASRWPISIRAIGVTEVTYYRWRQEYGGLRSDQV